MSIQNAIVWKEEYSVKVKEIDEQHQLLFKIINDLIKEINSFPQKEKVTSIISEIVKYKDEHFATEEKYFMQFHYPEAEEHIKAHRQFIATLKEIQNKFGDDTINFAFALVDFLEDWLIDHLMHMDRRYIECFTSHGLS
jgi:hemerythrin-like metal-binding protein